MASGIRDNFDLVIGRLDRCLSEFLGLYEADLDEADRQTLKHHADDLIGVGKKMHAELAKRPLQPMTREEVDRERLKFQEENPPWS